MELFVFKEKFDTILKQYLDLKINHSKDLLDDKRMNSFIEYFSTNIFSWGKRLRPYVLYLTYKGLGWKNDEDVLDFGRVFELFHSMALMHDDIIDESDKRHNVPTMHYYITSLVGQQHTHIAEWQTIILWDLLLAWVYELLYSPYGFNDNVLVDARKNFHTMVEEVILGQMIDVDMMTWNTVDQKMIEKKNLYKTARYSFMRPMLTWAILAWASQEQQDIVSQLWESIGLAFQVRDDLKDILAQDKDKRAFSDVQEGQQTCFTQYVYAHGTQEEQQLLKSCMWNELSDDQIFKLQKMFHSSWAIEYGKQLILDYSQKAKTFAEQLSFADEDIKVELLRLIEKISGLVI